MSGNRLGQISANVTLKQVGSQRSQGQWDSRGTFLAASCDTHGLEQNWMCPGAVLPMWDSNHLSLLSWNRHEHILDRGNDTRAQAPGSEHRCQLVSSVGKQELTRTWKPWRTWRGGNLKSEIGTVTEGRGNSWPSYFNHTALNGFLKQLKGLITLLVSTISYG